MFGTDVPVRQALRLFRGIGQHAFALIAEREIHGSRDLFPDRGVTLNLACGWTQPKRASEGIDWLGLYLRAGAPAAGARSQYKETRTGLLRSAQRKLRAWLSPYNVQT